MTNKAGKFFLSLCLVFTISCETDLEVAPYKDISIVYGLINIKDTVQYLRINRGFLCTDDPYNYTQTNDSVNYPDNAFEVFLEEYVEGELVAEIEYDPVDRQKEPGLFSNEWNCVYRTEAEIHAESEYKLRVIERSSGRELSGWATVLGEITIKDSFYQERAFYRVDYVAEDMHDYEGSLDPYDHEHYIMRFLYWEYADGETYFKYVDWVPTINPLMEYKIEDSLQLFDQYYAYLATQIPVNPNVRRRARGVDYMLALPGKELQNFIQVYQQPTNPHFFPEYSNVENGGGIFGSKYGYTYFGLKLKKRTIDTISWGKHLYHHRFVDSYGEWH